MRNFKSSGKERASVFLKFGSVFFLCIIAILVSSFAEAFSGTAALQKHVERFVTLLLTYETPHATQNLFEAEKYMGSPTDAAWRDWRDKWLSNAHFAKAASAVSVRQVLVTPRPGPGGEIRARAIVETRTAMLGKQYSSSGTVYVTLVPMGDGDEETYAVSYVRHESDSGGVFEISPNGVETRSALPEGTFDRLLMESSS